VTSSFNGPDYDTLYDRPSTEQSPPPVEAALAAELLAMTAEDHRTQAGGVGGTFEEQLAWRRVTARNGDRLREIMTEHGWPTQALVGAEASRCAWLIAQHADRQLDVQRKALALLERAVEQGAAGDPEGPRQIAFLHDRVLVNEGRRQLYGTQIAGVIDGAPVPWPCEDPENLDRRRTEVGIEPFDVHVRRFAPG
jgi:hypothetical protein